MQDGVEAVEVRLPGSAPEGRPLGDLVERAGLESQLVNATVDLAGDEAGRFEDVDVSAERLLGHLEGLPELWGGERAVGESVDDRPAVGVGEGLEGTIEHGGGHEVEPTPGVAVRQRIC